MKTILIKCSQTLPCLNLKISSIQWVQCFIWLFFYRMHNLLTYLGICENVYAHRQVFYKPCNLCTSHKFERKNFFTPTSKNGRFEVWCSEVIFAQCAEAIFIYYYFFLRQFCLKKNVSRPPFLDGLCSERTNLEPILWKDISKFQACLLYICTFIFSSLLHFRQHGHA